MMRALMHARPPDRFDPWKFAVNGGTLAGEWSVATLARFAELLHEPVGSVRWRLAGERDADGRKLVHVWLDAEPRLSCQRCLGPVTLAVQVDALLAPIAAESQAPQLPAQYEPLLAGDEGVSIAELLEDELILALPLVAMHEDERECAAGGYALPPTAGPAPVADGKPNPFAALSSLLKNPKDA
ncbi:MAG: hypothetical protein EKK65_06655 [Lysobacterales bacterium]|nr:MAG: hypothetical protein EKK65_06655 [Xanthomonadales bacterium]